MRTSDSSMVRSGLAPGIDELDVTAVGRSLWRKKRWILGLTLLAAGRSASFGEIIVRDRMSPAHVIMAGRAASDFHDIMRSPHFVVALEALARSYDLVVVDAGALPDIAAERLSQVMQVTILVYEPGDAGGYADARARAVAVGFKAVKICAIGQPGPDLLGSGSQRAA